MRSTWRLTALIGLPRDPGRVVSQVVRESDITIIGGGLVGAAIAYGLARSGLKPLVLDGGDRDFKAARANFGIIWVQGKGPGMPAYQRLTRRSADLWPELAQELGEASGIALDYRRSGGLHFCLGTDEYDARTSAIARLASEFGSESYDTQMIERSALERMLPGVRLGQEVSGASYCSRDGEVNPLRAHHALLVAATLLGASIVGDTQVSNVSWKDGLFTLTTPAGPVRTPRLIIAAGNGVGPLAEMAGLSVPLRPQRGQLLVTERMEPLIPLPTVPLRQTAEGGVLIGSTQEEVGYDVSTTVAGAARMASRACRILPALDEIVVVRHWAGLRVMTPDGHPIYAESTAYPGAFVALCHSGVTLAAAHALDLAPALARGALPEALAPFHPDRFHVPNAA